MNYVIFPSLEHMALVQIAVTLCNQNNIRAILHKPITGLLYSPRKELLQNLECEVTKQLQQLSLPEIFNEKILGILKPMCDEMRNWICYHEIYHDVQIMSNTFYWTQKGTLDFKKTAEVLIRDNNLDVKKRYILACLCCLEKDIPKLWNQIPEKCKENFYGRHGTYYGSIYHYLVIHWTSVLEGTLDYLEEDIMDDSSIYQFAFKRAAQSRNEEAAKYFIRKMTPVEIKECVVELIEDQLSKSHLRSPNLLCLLLSNLDEKQEREVMKKYSFAVLSRFLDWPLQTFFMDVAIRVRGYLDKFDSYKILGNMADLFIQGCKYNYKNLFQQFWEKMPEAHKRYVVHKSTSDSILLSKLLKIGDLDNFHVILNSATHEECIKIFSFSSRRIRNNKFYSLPLLMQVFVSSRSNDVVKFVKDFKERMRKNSKEEAEEEDTWNELFEKFDDFLINNKRILEEGENNPAKRLCNQSR